MKSTTTVLALASLYSADAFIAQEAKYNMQPLHADTLTNGRSMDYMNPTIKNTINSPFRPNKSLVNGRENESYGRDNESYGRDNENYGRDNENYVRNNENYGRNNENYGRNNESYGRNNESYGRNNENSGRNSNKSLVNGRETERPTTSVRNTANSPFAPPRFDSPTQTSRRTNNMVKNTKELFDEIVPVEVQGGSLKTCSFDTSVNRVSVLLKTTGRPLNANVELWQGPDNSPQTMAVYLEDGEIRPFRVTIESPGSSNAVAIRNTGQMEFPLTAGIETDMSGRTGPSASLLANSKYRTVQGGAVYTTPFPASVRSVQIALRTDGRPLNARVELLQGPNNNKQVMEVYTEDGQARPFYVIVECPGSGNVVRIVNTSTVEFPLTASAEPYEVGDSPVENGSPDGGMTWS